MKSNSKYFKLEIPTKELDNIKIFEFNGWSGLNLTKFILPKDARVSNYLINNLYPSLESKEKIFVTTKGNIKLKSREFDKNLNELDAVNFVSENDDYFFDALKNTSLFMISSTKSKSYKGTNVFFNFLRDIKAKNLWGGQIISRPYEGKELTLVLFDLKPGFKFEDKGHANEQITWLTKGKMNFYVNDDKKILMDNDGVSIGPNQVHGGLSDGAIGFDAFFPKRIEEKYKN